MARIKYGALVTEIHGSIGGTTFQGNQSGFSVKNKSNPGNSNSPYQQIIKQVIRQITQHWASLSDADRASWVTFATTYPQPVKHNSTSNLTGYSLYLRFNCFWFLRTNTIRNTPSFTLSALPVLSPSVIRSGAFLNVIAGTSFTDLLTILIISLSAPISPTINYAKNRVRYLSWCYASNDGVSIESQYLAQFGRLPEIGETVFVKISPMGLYAPKFWNDQYFKLIVTA